MGTGEAADGADSAYVFNEIPRFEGEGARHGDPAGADAARGDAVLIFRCLSRWGRIVCGTKVILERDLEAH